jgi:hypothetical protein
MRKRTAAKNCKRFSAAAEWEEKREDGEKEAK